MYNSKTRKSKHNLHQICFVSRCFWRLRLSLFYYHLPMENIYKITKSFPLGCSLTVKLSEFFPVVLDKIFKCSRCIFIISILSPKQLNKLQRVSLIVLSLVKINPINASYLLHSPGEGSLNSSEGPLFCLCLGRPANPFWFLPPKPSWRPLPPPKSPL